ncbi:protein kinase domain-containing protein [Leptolyngbya sp. AN02str]|uniref:protein kinase domain-containing protein n=1 Tax=Leptolyngbya sp. AN02str TaxID=3423363 RepID=UPI003D3159DB
MTQMHLREFESDEPSQRPFAVPEPFQPVPMAIASDLAPASDEPLTQAIEAIDQTVQAPSNPSDGSHQLGDVVADRYRILCVLGQGGVGTTYQAEDLQTGEQVALKALSLRAMKDWKQMQLFEREAQTLKQLNHPGIPQYLDYFHVDTPQDQAFYIVQQLAERESLADLVKQGWRSTEAEVKAIATQILEILTYLHSLEPPIVHRDIKPQNIIRRADGRVFLVDFGAVQNTYHNTLMRGSTVVGTFGYMAPEQFRGQANPATDFYGLAATLLFLLTWRSPADIPQDRLRINFRSRVQVSEAFADWLERMLEPDFEDRFSSATEALEALRGRRLVSKFHAPVPWKALVGVSLAAVTLVSVLNHYRWAAMRTLGFGAPGICGVIAEGNIGELRNYLNQGGNLARDEDTRLTQDERLPGNVGWPLVCALNSAEPEVAQLMISRISGVNGVDEYGLSPLIWATVSKQLTQDLLAQGANVNVKSLYGFTPLTAALRQRYIRLGYPTHPIEIHPEYEQVVKLLVEHGADVNAQNADGWTILNVAIDALPWLGPDNDESRPEVERVIKLLLDRGANVNATNRFGYTPLDSAVERNNVAIAKLLLDKGADINVKSPNGGLPLLHSAIFSGPEMVELLLQHGANVNAKDETGRTPLELLAMSCRTMTFTNGQPVCQLTSEDQQIRALLKRYGATE